MDNVMLEVEGLPEIRFGKNDIILEEGTTDVKLYILKEGAVRVTAAGSEICKINTPGIIFGEISALLNGDYTATVTAEVDSVFFVVDDLLDLFRKNPEMCLNVARLLALRLVNMNHLFAEIKVEIEKMQDNTETKKATSKLYTLIQKIDDFWGRDVLNPFSKKR